MATHPIANSQADIERINFNWRALRDLQPVWMYTTAIMLLWMVIAALAPLFDERILIGVSVWTKPFKFALSIGVYFATMILFTTFIPRSIWSAPQGKILTMIPVVMAIFEMSYITMQASIGEASHYNIGSSFHAVMYSLMGFGAVSMVAVLLWLGGLVAKHNSMSNPMAFAVVVGLVLTFVLGGGFGGYLSAQSGHWVNASPTDANGLALFNWARDGGDLRVAHFFGLHAMQFIPLFALFLKSVTDKLMAQPLSASTSIVWIIAFTCAFTAFTVVTFFEALAGQPFL